MIAALPLTLALSLSVLCFFTKNLGQWTHRLALGGSFAQFLLSGWILYSCAQGETFSLQAGAWPQPFGISFQIDLTSALLIWISSFLILGVHLYTIKLLPSFDALGGFHSVWHMLSAGVYGSFSTGDLFNLFVWFEVLLLASFVLMAMGARPWRLKANVYYVVLNLVGSSIFLLGLGFLYNSTGTLNFQDLKHLEFFSFARDFSALCLLIAFGMKAAAFPLFSWLPSSYPGTPIGPLALFAGLLTKVGIYTLLRFFGTPSALQAEWIPSLLLPIAGITMLVGVYGAATRMSMRRILSFHIVSQIGYMLLGIAIGGRVGLAATIFYLMHHMVVKTNLFLITGAIEYCHGSSDLKRVGAIARLHPWLAAGFAISALSLAGIPPLSGFWAKFITLYGAAQSGAFISVGVGMFVGLLTFYSMLKIWNEVFLKEPDASENVAPARRLPLSMGLPIVILCLWTVSLGIYPTWLIQLAELAASQLLEGK